MRAFLSHSSVDKPLVEQVFDGLQPNAAWLDKSEIELGDRHIKKLAEGIEKSTDFVLFWSAASAQSEWVQFELNMALIRELEDKAIRIRLIQLDDTPLPLELRISHRLNASTVSDDKATFILNHLLKVLDDPITALRHRFLNRNREIERIEAVIDDPAINIIWLVGFQGIGKRALIHEAIRRLYAGGEARETIIHRATGLVELAFSMRNRSGRGDLPEGLPEDQLLKDIQQSIEENARQRQFTVLAEAQNLLDDDALPHNHLLALIDSATKTTPLARLPLFVTSTRVPRLPANLDTKVAVLRISDLGPDHIAGLLQRWHEIHTGARLPEAYASDVARSLSGHPLAAKMAAAQIATFGQEVFSADTQSFGHLKYELATFILANLPITESAREIMELVSLANEPVPSSVIWSASGLRLEEYKNAFTQCAESGLFEYPDNGIIAHPMVSDFYWRNFSNHPEYQARSARFAKAVLEYIRSHSEQQSSSVLLPLAFRTLSLSGNIQEAIKLRSDLFGELLGAAITHYERNNYALCKNYLTHVIDAQPNNRKALMYMARVHVRLEDWQLAETAIKNLEVRYPNDRELEFVKGWAEFRKGNYESAIKILQGITANYEHYVSLTLIAQSLNRLNKNKEALAYVDRAEKVEHRGSWVHELRANVLTDLGEYAEATEALKVAAERDPRSWQVHHRVGQILLRRSLPCEAAEYFKRAVAQDNNQFAPHLSLVSSLIGCGRIEEATSRIQRLHELAKSPTQRDLVGHVEARLKLEEGDLESAERLIRPSTRSGRNQEAALGLLADIKIRQHDNLASEFKTLAEEALLVACECMRELIKINSESDYVTGLRSRLRTRDAPCADS